ncbi:MAG: restriction endonuclease [Proteobacteria bacterium]|uniref:BsuBI/PstI family type II restriction endonuclease n=1 Tax=Rudaea sp. TaxID=2136325 RepID=UPI001DBCF563|nr:restriction endonuclease [Pseudomonadota bacterium]MBS0568116.1 restriction endonuclease [Pseudomonadota bacterium]
MAKKIKEALRILTALGLPRAQLNARSAICLLALCNLKPRTAWENASAPLVGITPIMEFAAVHYMDKPYAPNTRETIRRQTMHQFCDAGIALYNPDDPGRAVNSPKAVYQISPEALSLVRSFNGRQWQRSLTDFLDRNASLASKYAKPRKLAGIPVRIGDSQTIRLSPGAHSELIRGIVEQFAPRFAPGSTLIYAGDTGDKRGFLDSTALAALNVKLDSHGKMPDVVIHDTARDWLLLCEAVTSHGPVDAKRHEELKRLFSAARPGLVFVTAFPTRKNMAKYLGDIAWETDVWSADAPDHLIHFNGERFLGPYA